MKRQLENKSTVLKEKTKREDEEGDYEKARPVVRKVVEEKASSP